MTTVTLSTPLRRSTRRGLVDGLRAHLADLRDRRALAAVRALGDHRVDAEIDYALYRAER